MGRIMRELYRRDHTPETRRRWERMSECGSYLKFQNQLVLYPKSGNKEWKHYLIEANFCGDKLCPLCAHIKSLRDYHVASAVAERIRKDHADGDPADQCREVFVTLTMPNIRGRDIYPAYRIGRRAYKLLLGRNRFRPTCEYGTILKTEITFNLESGTYNLHWHSLQFTRAGYFSKAETGWLNTEELSKMWTQCLNTARRKFRKDLMHGTEQVDQAVREWQIEVANLGREKEIREQKCWTEAELRHFLDTPDDPCTKLFWGELELPARHKLENVAELEKKLPKESMVRSYRAGYFDEPFRNMVVYMQAVGNTQKSHLEISKYTVKTATIPTSDMDLACQIVRDVTRGLGHQQMLNYTGEAWSTMRLVTKEEAEESSDWVVLECIDVAYKWDYPSEQYVTCLADWNDGQTAEIKRINEDWSAAVERAVQNDRTMTKLSGIHRTKAAKALPF